MLGLLFSVITAATAAPVTISNCELDQTFGSGRSVMYCDVTNTGTVAIGTIKYNASSRDIHRTIPWSGKDDGWPRGTMRISGGIEPGETLRHILMLPNTPHHAPIETLEIELYDLEALGADGLPITSPPKP